MKQATNPSLASIKAIIGLGNPGDRYYKTRHSIGYRIIDELVKRCSGNWHDRGLLQTAEITLNDRPIIAVKSNSYMNDSGKAIPYLLKKGITAPEILVVHDELEKPQGTVSIKVDGSPRGHNGLRSIISACGNDFYRLRIGIGRPENKADVAEYVLEPFACSETELRHLIDTAVELILNLA
jgi:PTH1 family peptidyl-tRNA hydrolase